MLSGKVIKLIKENSKYSIKQNLDDMKKEMNLQLNVMKPHEAVEIKFKMTGLSFDQLYMTDDGIITQFKILALMGAKIG